MRLVTQIINSLSVLLTAFFLQGCSTPKADPSDAINTNSYPVAPTSCVYYAVKYTGEIPRHEMLSIAQSIGESANYSIVKIIGTSSRFTIHMRTRNLTKENTPDILIRSYANKYVISFFEYNDQIDTESMSTVENAMKSLGIIRWNFDRDEYLLLHHW